MVGVMPSRRALAIGDPTFELGASREKLRNKMLTRTSQEW
jgi:hypothetical protein